MRFGTFTLSAIVSAMLMLGIGYMMPESRPVAPTPAESAERRIRQTLAEPSALNARDLPLRDAVERLSRRHRIPMALDYDALRAEGLTGNEPIRLDVSGVRLRDLLHLVVRQVHLCYFVRDGDVVITTSEARETNASRLVAKVYPLPSPSLGSPFVAEAELADLITSTIAPHCWAEVGGAGELRAIPGGLVVIQTPDIHEEVQSLLSHLEYWHESLDLALPIYLSSWDQEETVLIQKLKQTVDVEFHETSLEDVCRQLSSEYDVPIVISRRDLADLGLTFEAPISINLQDVPLDTALRKMLGSLGLGYMPLGWGVIEIVDGVVHGHEIFTRAYRVEDLIGPRRGIEGHGVVTLTEVVAPHNWDYVGGAFSIELMDDRLLLVSAERWAHEQIELYLGDLRDTLDPATPLGDRTGRLPIRRKIEAVLQQSATLQFENTLLDDVAEWISGTYGIDVRFDPPMSPDRADLPVTCKIQGRSLEEALRGVLRPLDRDVMVREGVLWFAAAWERASSRTRRQYDVRQLVDPDFGFLDERTLPELIHDATVLRVYGEESGGWCDVTICDGILIAYETRDIQKLIEGVLSYLNDNSRRLKREIEATDLSREDLLKRLLQEIRANVDMDANIRVLRDEADRLRDG